MFLLNDDDTSLDYVSNLKSCAVDQSILKQELNKNYFYFCTAVLLSEKLNSYYLTSFDRIFIQRPCCRLFL